MKIYSTYYNISASSLQENTQSHQVKKSEEQGNVFSSDFTFIQIPIQERVLIISPTCFRQFLPVYFLILQKKYTGSETLPAWILFPQTAGQATHHFLTDRQQIIAVYVKLPAVRIVGIVECYDITILQPDI